MTSMSFPWVPCRVPGCGARTRPFQKFPYEQGRYAPFEHGRLELVDREFKGKVITLHEWLY